MIRPVYSASKIPCFVAGPRTLTWLCPEFSHHVAAAVFLPLTFEPSLYIMMCSAEVRRFFVPRMAIGLSVCTMKSKFGIWGREMDGSMGSWSRYSANSWAKGCLKKLSKGSRWDLGWFCRALSKKCFSGCLLGLADMRATSLRMHPVSLVSGWIRLRS